MYIAPKHKIERITRELSILYRTNRGKTKESIIESYIHAENGQTTCVTTNIIVILLLLLLACAACIYKCSILLFFDQKLPLFSHNITFTQVPSIFSFILRFLVLNHSKSF